MLPVGMITRDTHLDVRSVLGSSVIAWSVRLASAAVAGESCLTTPPSSCGETSLRIGAIHGNETLIVAGVSRTPGRISRANARVGGNAALSEVNVRSALASVGASRRIEALRLPASDAKAAVVPLKLVIRSLSAF